MTIVLTALLMAWNTPAELTAADSSGSSAAKVNVGHRLSVNRARAGEAFQVAVMLDIAPGWHVQAAHPSFDYLVPTRLSLDPPPGIELGAVCYPPAKHIEFAGDRLAVYDGETPIRFSVSLPPDFAEGTHTLHGTLSVQACDDTVCLAPSTVTVEVPFDVIAAVAPVETNPDWFIGANDDAAVAPLPANDVERLFGEHGILLALAVIFVIGLALNLTPCVYPMLSVTVSIFGGQRDAGTVRVFFKALVYVLGMATMYSTLGVMAALTGGLFGGLMQSPWMLAIIAILLAALALSMFGIYEIRAPTALTNRLGGTAAVGLAGVYLSGLVVGIFAAPCIGPPIIALLTLVGAKGDPWFGFGSFFVLSLGLGAPYLILGTFSGLLKRLPKSGVWMVWVRQVFGVALLGVAAFYAALGFAHRLLSWIPAATLVLGGLYLGFVERSANDRTWFRRIKWTIGVIGIVAGIAMVIGAPKAELAWDAYRPETLEEARTAGKPVVLDFYADWCIPCHELDRRTFTDPDVIRALADHVRLKVDLTGMDSPANKAAAERFDVQGVPTIVFLDEEGRERPGTRVLGYLPPPDFIRQAKL